MNDSEDELEKLVTAQLVRAAATTSPREITLNNNNKRKEELILITESEEELDALIHEALAGAVAPVTRKVKSITTPSSNKNKITKPVTNNNNKILTNQKNTQKSTSSNETLISYENSKDNVKLVINSSPIPMKVENKPLSRSNSNKSNSSNNSSDNSSEAMLQAVLAGHGLPPLEGIENHTLFNKNNLKSLTQSSLNIRREEEEIDEKNKNEDDDLLMETLIHLTEKPIQFVSKQKISSISKEKDKESPISSSKSVNPISVEILNTKIASTTSSTIISSSSNNNNNNEKTLEQNLISENSTEIHKGIPSNVDKKENNSSSKKLLNSTQELEDEKRILSAILNAIQDRQSSVSGDLVCEEDGYNVDAVLQHAEDIAASSLQLGKGKESNIMHLHENIEMREELRKTRGSVGWPSCVCARTVSLSLINEMKEDNSLKNSISPSLTKRPFLCIGTTLGLVLLFDSKRKICGVCGSVTSAVVETRGSVVSLSMSSDASLVLSGHEHGVLVLWDTDALIALREIGDEYKVPITRLRHCEMDPLRAIILSGNGNIRLISFTRIISKTIYRLTHIATSVEEAPFNDIDIVFLKGEGIYLIAAVSADVLLLYALNCGLQTVATPIMRRTRPPKSARTHELIQFLSVPNEDRILMCVAWGADVEIFTVASAGVLTELQHLASMHLTQPLHAISPIMGSCLILLDQDNKIHLLDASAGVIVETRTLSGVEPVVFMHRSSGTRYSGSLAFISEGNEVILLGHRRAFTFTLLSWKDRLNALVRRRCFVEALELSKAFALEVALAVVGLHGDSLSRRAQIRSYLIHLITAYIKDALETSDRCNSELEERVICVVQFCADVDAMDVFFGSVMEFLRDLTGSDKLAFSSLERCILSGIITSIPEIYVEQLYYFLTDKTLPPLSSSPSSVAVISIEENNNFSCRVNRAERVLMRLDGSHELLMHIAEKNNLLQLAVSILSYRQHRYVEALQLALQECNSQNGNHYELQNNDNNNKGAVALHYFECTMRGCTIIEGVEFAEDQRKTAKEQLWEYLISISKKHLLILLHIHPQRVLRTALFSLQERGIYSPWCDAKSRMRCIGKLFFHLVGIELTSSSSSSSPPPPLRPWELMRRNWPPYIVVNELFIGITHLLLDGALVFDNESTHNSDLQRFCEYACSYLIYQFQTSEDEGQRRGVQNETAALFTSSITKDIDFTFAEEELRHQRMARALAALHCSRGEFAKAIDCYLDKENNRADSELAKDIFILIRNEMSNAVSSSNEKESSSTVQRLRDAVMHRISDLVDIDATLLAQFVFDFLPGNHEDVMNILRNSSETFLRYLDELVLKGDPAVANDVKLQNTYIELLCTHDPSRVYTYLHSNDSIVTYDLHLALNAVKRHKIADAAVFLLEKTLMIDEAMGILIGAVTDKLRLLRQEVINYSISFNEKGIQPLHNIKYLNKLEEESDVKEEKNQEQEQKDFYIWEGERPLQQVLGVGIDLCTKYNDDVDSKSSENWFRLLELFTLPRRLLCDRQKQNSSKLNSESDSLNGFNDNEIDAALILSKSSTDSRFPLLSNPLSESGLIFLEQMIPLYTKYVSHLLTHMIKVLDLSKVVGRIVEDHERERFGPFKPVIIDIMSSLSFELEVNNLCKLAIDKDIMSLAVKLHRSYNTGIIPISDFCYICEISLGVARGEEAETSVRIYACGHGYHESCAMKLGDSIDCVQCYKERTGETYSISCKNEINNSEISGDYDLKRMENQRTIQEEDFHFIIRRLRHTRAKIDGAKNYRDLLSSFLPSSEVTTVTSSLLKEFTGKKLLAPAPPTPINIGKFSEENLNFNTALTVTLTDEEVLELFGTQDDDDDDENNDGISNQGLPSFENATSEFLLDTALSGS